jgi:hypothetical protein
MASIAPQISSAQPGGSIAVIEKPARRQRQSGAWRDLISGDGPLFIRMLRWGQRHRRQT